MNVPAALTILSLTLCVVSSAAQQPLKVTSGVVLEDVTVVNTVNGSLLPHRTLVLEDGKIKTMTAAKVQASGTAQVVPASGRYVVPGFVDVHAHAVDTYNQSPSYLPLLLANGVTALREEGTTPANVQLASKVNAEAAAGTLLAPEIIFEGHEEHQPPNLSAFDASNSGSMPSFDHLGAGLGLVLDCSTDAEIIRKAVLADGYKMPMPPPMELIINPRVFDGAVNAPFYQKVIDTYSEAKCKTLAQTFAKNNTWQTLTLIRLRTQDYGNDPAYRNDPNLKYVSKQRRALWDSLGDKFAQLPPSAVKTLQSYYELQKRVSKLMADNGVKILAGSDVSGVWLIAGFSLHQEFHELAASGLTPLQVLQSTTLNAAQVLHREASMGTVEEGKNADLVLLEADPLQTSANLDRIAGVVVKGKYLSPADLAKLKDDVAKAYQ